MTGDPYRQKRLGRRAVVVMASAAALGAARVRAQSLDSPGLAPEPRFPLDRGLPLAEQLRILDSANKWVRLENENTGEVFQAAYTGLGLYDAAVRDRFNRFMRDWRENAVIVMDLALLEVLHALHLAAEQRPLHIVSGYRTPRTNAMLATISEGVAPNSLHMRGLAADFFVPGFDLGALRDAAIALQAGGVGFYPASGFIHVDTGPVRTWTL